jgi:hypothetical protein
MSSRIFHSAAPRRYASFAPLYLLSAGMGLLACSSDPASPNPPAVPTSAVSTSAPTSAPSPAVTMSSAPITPSVAPTASSPVPVPTATQGVPTATAPSASSPGTSMPSASVEPSSSAPVPTETVPSASVAPSASVTPSTTPTGSVPPGEGDALLIEDFEDATVGMMPAGWDNFVGYVKNNPQNPQGTALALVDDTRAHSGTKSMHFHGGQSPVQITRPLAANTNKLYVRGYFYMTQQLGQNPGLNHQTLIAVRKESGGANNEVRFGEIKGVIGTNEVPSDNISPKMDQWGMGPVVPANTWACIEVAFLADKPVNELHAWADGELVHSITAGDQWQNGTMPDNWLADKFVEVVVGWQSFGGDDIDVWLDDLVLSNDPIGCDG